MATILREKTKCGDKSYLLRIKYTASDAKVTFQNYIRKHAALKNNPITKENVVDLFSETCLSYLPKRNALPLANWLFDQSVKNGLVLKIPKLIVDGTQEYIINPEIENKRPGPKTKSMRNGKE